MKKLITGMLFTLCLILSIFLLDGCGSKGKEKKYRIGVAQCSDDDWRKKMNEEIEREVMMHPEIEVEIRSAADRNDKQIEDIRYFIDKGVDILLVAPNEADALTPVIKEVYDSGIPVLIFDRSIHGDSFTAWRGADNKQIGRAAARYVNKLENEHRGNGTIIELRGNPASTPAQERNKGFLEEIASYPDLNVVGWAVGNWTEEGATPKIDSLYHIHPDVDIIYAHNDRMAIAAREVADRHGIHPRIIGIDGAPNIGIRAVADSVIDATFIYPTQGGELIQTALKIVKGEKYERIDAAPTSSAVDLSNADILLLQNNNLRTETSKLKVLQDKIDEAMTIHDTQTSFFYAVVIILLLLAILLFAILRLYWSNRRYQRQLEQHSREVEEERDKQEYLNKELEKATQSKLIFFTNVSHDLRTPLTLISEPVEQLRKADNLTAEQKELTGIASKNVRILQRLINQILDFRKYENDRLDLHLTEVNIGECVKEWGDSFRALARKRDIKFHVEVSPEVPEMMAMDSEKMERVFFNLVSNAFKHTPSNGDINVTCREKNNKVILEVADTGEGIAQEDIGRIFERFFQVEKVRPKGSGIGLTLTKAFVELHGGEINVESAPGKGTTFRVELPITHVENKGETTVTYTDEDVLTEVGPVETAAEEFDKDKPLLLMIDDNADMRNMVASLLKEEYNVLLAPNGKEGLRLAAKYVPDLVISDVMMPVMDGFECTRKIKEEVSTSHIPVLLLTACSMDEQRAEGYESGADGYLSKPFSSQTLLARCRSLIANRRRIKTLWRSSVKREENEETKDKGVEKGNKKSVSSKPQMRDHGVDVGPVDNEFYNRFLEKVKAEMGNPDLNVDGLASEMGLGRSQFYRKIKALTNYSPVELLRRLRLQRARDLVTTSEKSISEIAYEVGFSTPAYFTKCFRDAYGETPTELREKLGR